ncbi:hypothetical protein TNIN_488451 [Trichonephila inaurata madagascariensis]|uniref:Uncharacterized protein n=1 Tax=Trichonephila inaurata madagascariensis TaxID=2747483 RepID=A0A8X6XMF9_9ARAC|nr:hypothetical protein TNIN_488451 [Trichonephila inaurata madagascariensis]
MVKSSQSRIKKTRSIYRRGVYFPFPFTFCEDSQFRFNASGNRGGEPRRRLVCGQRVSILWGRSMELPQQLCFVEGCSFSAQHGAFLI